jgi:chromosome segregation ATPase
MVVDKYELGKKMVALASQYRDMGDALSVDAYTRLVAKAITKEEYDEIHAKVDELFAKSIEISKQVGALTEGSIEADLDGIESATGDLKQATAQIAKIRKIVDAVIDVCTAIGTVVLAATTPNPATIAAAVESTIALAQEISKMTSNEDEEQKAEKDP